MLSEQNLKIGLDHIRLSINYLNEILESVNREAADIKYIIDTPPLNEDGLTFGGKSTLLI